jgi:hypothetical protein
VDLARVQVRANPCFPTYGSFSPPIGPYGYGAGMPRSPVVTAGGSEWEELHALEITARKVRDRQRAEIYQEEWEEKHALEITARDREIAEKFQELEQLKQVEINRQTEDKRWHSDELKKIETKDRKSELDRLRVAARELEEANRLMKAEEEEIAQLKRAPAAKEDNRRSNNIHARSSVKKISRQEDEVVEEEDEEWEASSKEEEERSVRRSSAGNIVNSTMSNVGNDNSKVVHLRSIQTLSPRYNMNSSTGNSNSSSSVRERRRTLMACMNCRSRKLKVSKPFSKVSFPCSRYPSVVHSNWLIVPLVNDVSKKEISVNIVPSVQPRTTMLLIILIKITPSTFILSSPLLCQTKNPLFP